CPGPSRGDPQLHRDRQSVRGTGEPRDRASRRNGYAGADGRAALQPVFRLGSRLLDLVRPLPTRRVLGYSARQQVERRMMTTGRLTRDINPMPDDVREELEARGLYDRYLERPPYQQNDYLGWISRAKLPATRQKRIVQML